MNLTNNKTKIYFGGSIGKGLSSFLIRRYQYNFPITHVFYVLEYNESNPQESIIIEAYKGKVRKNKIIETHENNETIKIFSLEIDNNKKEILEDFYLSQVGKGYDYMGILGFPFRNKKIQDKDKWFCSELLYAGLMKAKIPFYKYLTPQEVSPRLFLLYKELKIEKLFKVNKDI